LGIISANIGWRVFTDHFGIAPPIDLPVLQLAILVVAAVAGAIGVSLAFVPNARRVHTLDVLAGE
jgi:hypothetical protein